MLANSQNTLSLMASFFLLFAITACKPKNNDSYPNPLSTNSKSATITNVPESAVHFLITSAAHDFRKQAVPPLAFRNLRIGYILTPDNERQFLLCGEFLHRTIENKEEWENFATIKTGDYEQYIGDNMPKPYCEIATMVLSEKDSLSIKLERSLSILSTRDRDPIP